MKENKIQIQTEAINKIYQEYLGELSNLRGQQEEVIEQFIEALKQEKLTEIKEKIKSIS